MIQHNRPTLGDAERRAAARVLASGWVAQGPEVEAFEDEVCRYLGLPSLHAVALSSGTAALFVALWVLAARGKSVAVPAYSCVAVRNAVLMAGAEPIPIDVAPDSPNIDLQLAVRASPDLIVAAHLLGMPSRWERSSVRVPIIEDCAQAFGARIDGHPVGLNGTVGVFSFYASKMFTSGGQGGMLVSSDRSLVDAARDYREFDGHRDRVPRFNLQMTDLQAAIGRAQLEQIEVFLRKREYACERYAAGGLDLWPREVDGAIKPCNYRAIIRAPDPVTAIAELQRNAIRAIVPIADWELLEDPAKIPRAAALSRSTLSLPLHPSLTEAEISAVTVAVATTLKPL